MNLFTLHTTGELPRHQTITRKLAARKLVTRPYIVFDRHTVDVRVPNGTPSEQAIADMTAALNMEFTLKNA